MLGLHNITNEVSNLMLFGKKRRKGEQFSLTLPKLLMGLVCSKSWSRTFPPSSTNTRADSWLCADDGIALPNSGLMLMLHLMIYSL